MNQELLTDKILSIIEKTKEDKIPWTMASAQSVRWQKVENNMSQTYTITITMQKNLRQRVASVPAGDNYTFTFQTTRPNQVIVNINTTIDTSIKYDLANLYHEAVASSKRKAANLLDELIKGV